MGEQLLHFPVWQPVASLLGLAGNLFNKIIFVGSNVSSLCKNLGWMEQIVWFKREIIRNRRLCGNAKSLTDWRSFQARIRMTLCLGLRYGCYSKSSCLCHQLYHTIYCIVIFNVTPPVDYKTDYWWWSPTALHHLWHGVFYLIHWQCTYSCIIKLQFSL